MIAYDDSLFTPLHSAVGLEKIDVVHLLLSHPTIDVNAVNSAGRTPLHLAVPYPYSYLEIISNKTKIAAFLLGKGANINIRDVDGLTPLDKAMKYKQKELILLLTRYSCVANMWTHWDDLQFLYNNYMQWLPEKIVQDIEVLCPQEKNRWRFWAPPEPQYDSYVPWLPREMVEDVAILVKADVINGDLISTPKPT